MPVQSPIAISTREANYKDDVEPLEYHGHWEAVGTARIENTGTSAMITFARRPQHPYILGGPLKERYIFEQLHFHWADTDESGCEHTLEGNKYSMEAHAVHYNSKYKSFTDAADKPDGLAVTAFFIQACGDKDCPEFKKTTEGIRNVQVPFTQAALDSGAISRTIPGMKFDFISILFPSFRFRLSFLDWITRIEQTLLHVQGVTNHCALL